jgi:hypothetical protein
VASLIRDRVGRRASYQIGFERVRNFAFVERSGRTNFLVAVSLDAYRR